MTIVHRKLARAAFAGLLALGASAVLATAVQGVVDARHRPRGRLLRVRGGLVHLREAGRPDADLTVVMLHGTSLNLEDLMIAFERPLGRSVRLVAVDRPGSGWTDRGGGVADASFAMQGGMILDALDAAGVGDFVVLGHSWSGGLACRIALERPERVSGIVVLSGASMPWPVGRKLLRRAKRLRFLGDFLVRSVFTPMIHWGARPLAKLIFAPQSPPPGYVGAAGIRLLARPDRLIANAEDLMLIEQGLERLEPRVGEIVAPTLIIHGEADRIIPVDVGRRLHARITGSRYLELPGIGHMPHHAAKPQVLAALEGFLAEIRRDRVERGTSAALSR